MPSEPRFPHAVGWLCFKVYFRWPAGPEVIQQPIATLALKAHSPLAHNARRHPQLPGDFNPGDTLGGFQDNLGTQDVSRLDFWFSGHRDELISLMLA
jgi:hypothetical protein